MRPLPLPRSLLPESSAGSGASSSIGLAQAPVVMLVTISWRLWAARRSPAFRSAEHDVLKQHHEEPEREASRCLVRAAVLVCALYACMLRCAHTEADGSARCKGDHIHDDRCS